MKIKSCEIGNFGKLEGKTIQLDDRITVIRGENESGKTTLSAFIKYVLYGYGKRGRDERGNDKLRYTPWKGKGSAGALTLTLDNGEFYRVERSAVPKETSKIINYAGKTCFEGEEPGEALLGIDLSTYTKSAFVGQMDVEPSGIKDIGASVERLILDAQDDISSANANKILNNAKNSLYNKMRSTGKIFDINSKISALCEKKNIQAENHKELISSKYSFDETDAKVKSNKELLAKLYAEIENIDAYDADRRLLAIKEAVAEKETCCERYKNAVAVASFGDFIPDRVYFDELSRAFSDYLTALPERAKGQEALNDASSHLSELVEGVAFLKSAFSGVLPTPKALDLALEKAKKLYSGSKTLKVIAIVLCCLVLTLPVALIVFIISGNKKKKAEKLVSDSGFSSVSEFSDFAARYAAVLSDISRAQDAVAKSKRALEEKDMEFSMSRDMLTQKLSRMGYSMAEDSIQDIKDRIIPSLSMKVKECETALSEYKNAENALKALMSVSDMEELSKKAEKKQQQAPARSREAVDREIRYTEGANALLEKKLSELSAGIARLEAICEDPSEIEAELSSARAEFDLYTLKHDALELAIKVIEDSKEDIRLDVLPVISRRASELFSDFTDKKYRSLTLDSDFGVSVLEENDTVSRSVGFLSAGAVDTAYLALRISFAEHFCRENPTLIFDDSFVKMDETRLSNILRVIKGLSENYQIVILTCHTREEMFFGKDCKIITM